MNYYQISYTKKVGGTGTFTVKGNNEKEALSHAIHGCATGSHFRVVKQVAPTKDTVKGLGRNRMN